MSRDRVARAARIWSGVGLIAVGIALLVLPGPGIPALLGGVALLEPELPWLRRWTEPVRVRLAAVRVRAR